MNSGHFIKEELHRRGIKQIWLAKRLNISNSSLSAMLTRDLKVQELNNICSILCMPINEVLNKNKKEDSAIPPRTTESSQTEI